ncbi:MAG: nitrous oxide reductase family maturation protein NosD [Myxococcota bacterium]
MIPWSLPSWASDHDAAAPAAVAAEVLAVPVGPARRVSVTAGAVDLQAQIHALPAGSEVHLGPGNWRGPVVIDRPLTLTGSPGTVIDGGGVGSVVIVAADDVTIRDLTITGGGHQPQRDDSGLVLGGDRFLVERVLVHDVYLGIDVRLADHGVVRDCEVRGDPDAPFGLRGDGIRLWESDDDEIAGNTLSDVRDLVVWYSEGTHLHHNVVTDSRYGTHLMHAADVHIEANTYTSNVVGVFAMYSSEVDLLGNTVIGSHGEAGVGIGLKESDALRIERNVLIDDTTGIYLDTTPQRGEARFVGNLIAANGVGVRMHGRSIGAVFTGNGFVANRVAAGVDSRGSVSGVVFEGNHWSDYAGYDLDGDGTGDLPFELRSLSGALAARDPALAWFSGTPAWALIDLFGAAFPMFAPTVVLTDRSPATSWEPR